MDELPRVIGEQRASRALGLPAAMGVPSLSRPSAENISSGVPSIALGVLAERSAWTKKVLVSFLATARPNCGKSRSITVMLFRLGYCSRKVRRTVRSLMVAWMRMDVSPLSVPSGAASRSQASLRVSAAVALKCAE